MTLTEQQQWQLVDECIDMFWQQRASIVEQDFMSLDIVQVNYKDCLLMWHEQYPPDHTPRALTANDNQQHAYPLSFVWSVHFTNTDWEEKRDRERLKILATWQEILTFLRQELGQRFEVLKPPSQTDTLADVLLGPR